MLKFSAAPARGPTRSGRMKFRIRHITIYRYPRPVTLGPHRLLLTPRGDHDLRVLARKLDS